MPRLLIVDDEEEILFPLRLVLTKNGFQVDAYSDPELALQNFGPGKYDLAVLDIRMPKLNGFQLFKEMKRIDARVPIVFMTAFEVRQSEFKLLLPDYTVSGFIAKPVTPSNFVSYISELIAGGFASTR